MKKKLLLVLSIIVLMSTVTGCNKTMFDTTYSFDRAIIQLADGTIVDTKVKKWTDYDGEQIQIEAPDGTIYLTSSFRCDLIKSK